ncbi:hypothetical protein KC19_11G053700 [Ceratodon purpureus]|uniref:Uncharacterized protein n=1 Tax=Ceratodon purpureus TaxID=3225 RepID=A0A8T0GCH9_CERPU|nr:hypothetical protein KC19_11G053700 [Ceratodon purpureus]
MDYEVIQRRRLCRSSCPGCKTKQSPGREEDHHEWRVSVATPQPGTQFSSKNYELSTCCRLQHGPAPMCPKKRGLLHRHVTLLRRNATLNEFEVLHR